MQNREKLVSRIQKLLALASRNPSATEAESALLQAQKLMAEHSLSEADVQEEQDRVESQDLLAAGRMDELRVLVLLSIATAHRCKLIRSRKPMERLTTIKLVGYERDRAVVVALNQWAWRCVSEAAKRFVAEMRPRIGNSRADLFQIKHSFIRGFATGLSKAYKAQAEANPQWALVLAMPPEVTEFVKKEAPTTHAFSQPHLDASAYRAGVSAGESHVTATSHKDAPRLDGLPRMLGA